MLLSGKAAPYSGGQESPACCILGAALFGRSLAAGQLIAGEAEAEQLSGMEGEAALGLCHQRYKMHRTLEDPQTWVHRGVPWFFVLFWRFIGVGVCLYAHVCVCLPAHVCEHHIQLDDCKVQKKTSDPLELQVILSLLVGAEILTRVLRKSSKCS